MKVHKVEMLVMDFDGLGADGVKEEIENTRYANRCISPEVKKIETRTVEWSDDHPLNHTDKCDEAYAVLFP